MKKVEDIMIELRGRYNNISNKFDLEQYGRNIEQNLTNKIAEEISIFFVSINDN